MELISAEQLRVRYGEREALSDVSLTVREGDFITIVGPNGAGKSTLLKCLLGLMHPHAGRVRRARGLRLGYVPQRVAPRSTVPMPLARFLALNKRASAAAARAAAQLTGIENRLDTPLAALSGGEMQRALLARALMDQPTLLALDEPAQNLDVGGEIAFYQLLDKICESRDMAVLMVSHDLHFVMRRSKQVICLYHHVCCSGAPHEVSRDPAFEKLFGGDMAQLMAVYHHRHNHRHDLPDAPAHLAHTAK